MNNRFVENYRAWRRYRQTIGELARLTNRELDDPSSMTSPGGGISRYDLRSVARRSAGL